MCLDYFLSTSHVYEFISSSWLRKIVNRIMPISQMRSPEMETWSTFPQNNSHLLFSHSVVSDSLWPMDYSTPGFPVLHLLLELAQTRVHWIGDAIQPSGLLLAPSPPAFYLSQHQSFPMSWLFASGRQSIGASASVLPMNIQGWFPLGKTGLILQSKGL